jgi:EmrB/QacA subfamily drug resistance transporter
MGAIIATMPEALRAELRVLLVCLGTLVVPLDSMVNLDFPSIIERFSLAIPDIQWVVISYTLTHASLLLVFGRVGDMVGHRRIFLAGSLLSGFAFVACGAAPSFAWLLGARCLQGMGAGLVLSCGAALVTSYVPETRRARVLALYTLMFGLGSALGPLVAGFLVARWGWSAVFWFRAPLSLCSFALGFLLPPTRAAPRAERFDAPGAVLLVVTIAALLLTLNRLRTPWLALVLAGVTAAALLCFLWQERHADKPIIDPNLFRIRGFARVNLGHALMNLGGFAIMLLMPFYLDRVAALPPLRLGAVLAASPLGMMLAAPIAGRLAGRAPTRALTVTGAACATVGLGLIATLAGSAPVGVLAGAMLIQGFGLGLFQVAYFETVTATMPRHDRGVAGSLVMLTRTGGVVLGATLLMLVFQVLRGTSFSPDPFLFGFRGAFCLAAVLCAGVLLLSLDPRQGRARASAGAGEA